MRKELSQKKKFPQKKPTLTLNSDSVSSTKSGMYSNFQKSKTNNTNTSNHKSQMTEVNLTTNGNLSNKVDLKDRETVVNKGKGT